MVDTLLTFLFTDLENSTPLWEQYPAEMQSASARHDLLLRLAIESHRGRVIKTTGDGFHAVFAAPLDALAATLAGQQAVLVEPWDTAVGPLKVRMGLHTGESRERAGDYYGVEVNRAARIMALGYGGQVLLSGVTAALVRQTLPAHCSLLDLGQQRLKGLSEFEPVFQLRHPDLPADFPPLKSMAAFRHNLPSQRSPFIGREQEIEQVVSMLADTRLLTLLGPGGTGKTRLMLQVAEEVIEAYPDGVWLVELAPLTDPEQIPERVAAALRVQEQPRIRPLDTLIEYLRRKELLLLLDNVEHVVTESAELADQLLDSCPGLTLLVTGREALFIAGEKTLQIPSLSLPPKGAHPPLEAVRASEGVQFFVERGRAVDPDFALTERNAAAIAEITRRLDGIPLALELAAARLRMLTAEQIAARLNDRFRLLTGGRRTALPRQQTLEALIEWSWNLLNDTERVLLQRLSVFAGGWTLEAAQSVVGFEPLDEFTVFDELEQLINKSLVIVRQAEQSTARYDLLESIHQYARAKLVAAGEADLLRERHVAYFVELVDAYAEEGMEQDYYGWRARLAQEADNLRAVYDWIAGSRPGLALHFAGSLLFVDVGWMPFREACSWLEPAIAQARALLDDPSAEIEMPDFILGLYAYGWTLITHGEMNAGFAALDECIRLGREIGNTRAVAFGLGAKAQAMSGSVTAAIIAQMLEAIEDCRRAGDNLGMVMLLFSTAYAYLSSGEPAKARVLLDEGARTHERLVAQIMEPWLDTLQAALAQAEQDYAKAEQLLVKVSALCERLDDQRMGVTVRSSLAHLYREQGRFEEATALYRQTILAWQEQGHQSAVAHQMECFAYIALALGDYEVAAQLLGAAGRARHRLNALSSDPQEMADLEAAQSRLAAELPAPVLEQLLQRGEALSLDEAVVFALREPAG